MKRGTYAHGLLALSVVAATVDGGCSCTEDQNLASDTPTTGATGGTGGTGGGGTAAGGCTAGLQSIELLPDNSTVTLDGGDAQTVQFVAMGTFSDGTEMPVNPAALTWTVTRDDDTPAGTIAAGILEPYPSAGGVLRIEATDGCVSDDTTLTLFLDVVVGAPENPDDWTGTPVAEDAPGIVYPSDETRFPRNLYRTLFQWYSQGYTDFRLVFEGPNSTVTVFTDGVHGLCAAADPVAGCWEVDEDAWNFIAASNAGATATWVVDALDSSTMPPTIRRSAAIDIGFSKEDVEGAIFYWSTTVAGIRRGRISQQDPENYVAGKNPQTVYPVDNKVGCVACHVVSRSGKYLAAPTSANTNSLWIYEVTADAPPAPLVTDIPETGGHGFATISPDDVNVVAAWKGKMWMVDRATGDYIVDLPLGTLEGTHPDWSPANDELVFVTREGDAPDDASLARIPYNNGTWGTPAVFLTPPMGKTLNFPMFSHDAAWIAYNIGNGGHTDVQSQLMLIAAQNGQPIELINANRVVSNQMTDGIHQNTGPTWAPKGDLQWIAFNSQREYGVVREEGNNQIWVAAVDETKAAAGEDPSYPAFRVPFQGLDEANHRAFWTIDVGDPGSGGAGGGGPTCGEILTLGETCDPVADCCETGSYCDSPDGTNFTCVFNGPS